MKDSIEIKKYERLIKPLRDRIALLDGRSSYQSKLIKILCNRIDQLLTQAETPEDFYYEVQNERNINL